ncbi:MAG: Re/Si-specific NAD(P)(+) transhydrogenase subunit alpha [Verrucomicrobiota bacterium]
MKIVIPKETHQGERRAAFIPASIAKLTKRGAEIEVESGAGQTLGIPDDAYAAAGAKVVGDRNAMLGSADMILRLRKPSLDEVNVYREGSILVSHLDPFNSSDLIRRLEEKKISAICMEMIPRSTRAQKMDVLSSQANLAGYVAVVIAAEQLNRIFPMMTTAGGTIQAAQVFIIGAGVAGLQAIATAKRLGARVEAFDTRPIVEEQVQSLGAKFVKIDIGETGQTKEGYAKALTEEQLAMQREGMKKICAHSDVVISTAQVFGRKAPRIITGDMIDVMKPGSIVVDLAVESGGNVEGSVLGQIVEKNGVKIVGLENLPGRVAVHATQMYSTNLYNLIDEFWNKEGKKFDLKLDDDIIQGALVTHDGKILKDNLGK